LAQKLYDSIEKHLGASIEPSGFLTKDGHEKLWQKRRPEAVKDHRWSPYHGHYLSPLQIKRALTLVDANLTTPGLNPRSAWAKELPKERASLQAAWDSLPQAAKDRATPDQMFSLRGFYSPAGRAIDTFKQDVATAQQWKALLTPGKTPGVTKDWADYVDLDGALKQLADEKGKVSKAALKAYIDAADADLDLVTLRGPDAPRDDGMDHGDPDTWEEDRRDELDSSYTVSSVRRLSDITPTIPLDEMIKALTDDNSVWELLEEEGFANPSGSMEKAPTFEDMKRMGFIMELVTSDAFSKNDWAPPVIVANEKHDFAVLFASDMGYTNRVDAEHFSTVLDALQAAQEKHDEAVNETIDYERPEDTQEYGRNDDGAETKYHDYKIPGALYVAELLVKPKNLSGVYVSKHFNTHEIIHQRLGEVDLPPLPGKTAIRKGLLIEETQSDAHALGEERGYETPDEKKARTKAFDDAVKERNAAFRGPTENINKAVEAYQYNIQSMFEIMRENVASTHNFESEAMRKLFERQYGDTLESLVHVWEKLAGTGTPVKDLPLRPDTKELAIDGYGKQSVDRWGSNDWGMHNWIVEEMYKLLPENQAKLVVKYLVAHVDALSALKEVEKQYPSPELPKDKMLHTPYKGGLWLDLGLKLALRYAVENGYDTIVLPKARMIGDAVGASVISSFDWDMLGNDIVITLKDKGGMPMLDEKTRREQTVDLKGDPDGGYTGAIAWVRKKFGDDAAETLRYDIAQGTKSGLQNLNEPMPLGNTVGREAMPKGGAANLGMQLQYEDRTPAFFAKYTAKWGGKVAEEPVADMGVMNRKAQIDAALDMANDDGTAQHVVDELWNAQEESRYQDVEDTYRGLSREARDLIDAQKSGAPVLKTIDITPQMREAILGGQPLYNKSGEAPQLDGYWSRRQRTIGISLSAADPMRVFHEESAHALGPNGLNLLTPKQNALLRQTAVKEGWIEKYIGKRDAARYRAAYRHAPDVEGLLIQEAIDHAYANYAINRDAAGTPAEAAKAFDRVREFFARTKEALASRGARSVGDVFGGMYSGDVGGRYRDPELIRFHDLLPVAGGRAGASSGQIDFADLIPNDAPVIGAGVRLTFDDLIPRGAAR
jgi:hypothetical protein